MVEFHCLKEYWGAGGWCEIPILGELTPFEKEKNKKRKRFGT